MTLDGKQICLYYFLTSFSSLDEAEEPIFHLEQMSHVGEEPTHGHGHNNGLRQLNPATSRSHSHIRQSEQENIDSISPLTQAELVTEFLGLF